MCIICSSARGVAQPTEATLKEMFKNNPHGAGYMTARDGRVEISKGFMNWNEFIRAVRYENFTEEDAVVYHFRISTQAGVSREMTHPFPLTTEIDNCKLLDVGCRIGIAHNGIIRLTSNPQDKTYSDTAHFIAEYLAFMVRCANDIHDPRILRAIGEMTASKWAMMDSTGEIATVGHFTDEDGILYSNGSYKPNRFTLCDVNPFRRCGEMGGKPYGNSI